MPPSNHSGSSVLIADDEPLVVEFVQRILDDAGYRTFVCFGGHSAVKFIAEHGADVDTVLTDVAMPDIDGLHVAAAAKEKWPTTRVVYMSGSREGTARLPCEDLFLPKPFSREQLLTAVLPLNGIDADAVPGQCAMS